MAAHKCKLKKQELVERVRSAVDESVKTFTECGGGFHRSIAYGHINAAWQADCISEDERRDYLATLKWASIVNGGN